MAGSIVILGSIPRTTGTGITVVHAAEIALVALAIIIIRITFRAALAFACRELLIPIPACMAGAIVILGSIPRTTCAGITVVHAGLTALVALAVIIIRITLRTTGTGITVVHAAEIALVALAVIIIRITFGTALAVARGVDIVSRIAPAAVIRSHRSYNRKDKKDKTGRQQEPVCCQT